MTPNFYKKNIFDSKIIKNALRCLTGYLFVIYRLITRPITGFEHDKLVTPVKTKMHPLL